MKKKWLVLSISLLLVTILLASLVSTSCKSSTVEKDKIVIGMPSELTGVLAQIRSSAFQPVLDAWLADVNGAGGLNIGGKRLPVEMLIYDDKSDVSTAAQLMEKLIVEDKVDFVFPPGGTAMIFAAAPIANKYGYILTTMEGGATQMKDVLPSLPYVFVNLSFSDWYQLPVLADILAAKGCKTAYIVYIADLHGIEYSGVAGIELPKKGIEIIGTKSLPPEMTDFSLVIKEAKAANPDAFLCFGYPDQNLPVTGEMYAQNFNPKFFMTGPGANFGFYHDAFGPLVEGVGCFAAWNPNISAAQAALADKLYSGKPEAIQDWWGHCFYWAGLEFFQQAVEEAGTLDQSVIREIMATSHFQTVLGDTWYENGLMAKESHPGEIGQWQNGVIEIVGGNQTTADLVYPKPPWPTE
ncbi:MAG: amino acid ABC transporter substrate-binding protein [Dehalococcoidales bacterium]|nr:amino acid ABC transporter substrate-binding protein [Dehalococcoidales bacterium]